jgi:hypothetical protein
MCSPCCSCTTVGRYRGGDAYQDTALPPASWKHWAFGCKYLGELNRGTHVAPVTLTNSLRSLSFLESRDCRKMAEMSGNKIPEETTTANDKREGTNHSKVLEK